MDASRFNNIKFCIFSKPQLPAVIFLAFISFSILYEYKTHTEIRKHETMNKKL
jgi:hypothetical protein